MIATETQAPIFTIKLNRPDKRNAIQVQLLQQIAEAVAQAEQDPSVRLIVIRGEGKSFSTGLDVITMGGVPAMFGDDWMQRPHVVTRVWQDAVNRLTLSSLPIVVLIHGYCIGAGLELALACDFRYSTPEAILSLEEARLGMIPDVGGTTRLTQLVGPSRAKEIILTGRRIDGTTAERWGLVNRVMLKDEFDAAVQSLAEEISGCAPLAVAAGKRIIQGIVNESQGLVLEQIEQAALFHTADLQEGIQAIMERRKPVWKAQ